MSNDFSSFSDDAFDENPDWLADDDFTSSQPVIEGGDDEFDQLRRKSARTGSMQDDMEAAEPAAEATTNKAFAWSSFTPGQRLVLALLVVLDIIAIAFGVMVLTGAV